MSCNSCNQSSSTCSCNSNCNSDTGSGTCACKDFRYNKTILALETRKNKLLQKMSRKIKLPLNYMEVYLQVMATKAI